MMSLTLQEEQVIKLRSEMSLREIGKLLGLSHSRIWSIEQKALRKMRNPRFVQKKRRGITPPKLLL